MLLFKISTFIISYLQDISFEKMKTLSSVNYITDKMENDDGTVEDGIVYDGFVDDGILDTTNCFK